METARMPDAPDGPEKKAVIIDTEYFPSVLKPHALRELTKLLHHDGVPLIFFTDKKCEDACGILKQLGLAEQERDVIDEEQFACYLRAGTGHAVSGSPKRYEAGAGNPASGAPERYRAHGHEGTRRLGSDYTRQMKTIRAYAGLNEQEKNKVVEAWRKECDWLYVLPDRSWRRPEEEISGRENPAQNNNTENVPGTAEKEQRKESGHIAWLGLLDEFSLDRDVYFKKHWSDGLLRLLQCEKRWNTFENITEKVQERTLAALCIFNGLMLLAGILGVSSVADVPVFHGMFLITAVVCGGLALWKELWWLRMRH